MVASYEPRVSAGAARAADADGVRWVSLCLAILADRAGEAQRERCNRLAAFLAAMRERGYLATDLVEVELGEVAPSPEFRRAAAGALGVSEGEAFIACRP